MYFYFLIIDIYINIKSGHTGKEAAILRGTSGNMDVVCNGLSDH